MRRAGGGASAPPALTGTLLVVFNPRRIKVCLDAFEALQVDRVYLRGMDERAAVRAASQVLERQEHRRYVLVSDDVVVPRAALGAVVAESRPDRVVSGYCSLDRGSPYVNVTDGWLQGSEPQIDAYSFRTREEMLAAEAPVFTGFVGFALTCIPAELKDRILPLGCFAHPDGSGYAADFHLSKRLQTMGVPMVAVPGGYVRHLKERWNRPDRNPEHRLRLGDPEVVWRSSQASP